MSRPAVFALIVLAAGCQHPVPAWPPADPAVECTSLLGMPLRATPPADRVAALEANLEMAQAALANNPADPDRWIWVGRRLGYLWRMRQAIDVYTDGVDRFPSDARFRRHRGHRFISVRQFDLAIADLRRAASLCHNRPDEIEPDGIPNAANRPLTTLQFNVWYHLGVANYLKGDFTSAAEAFQTAGRFGGGHDDNVVAVADWTWMSLRRLGRPDEADRVLIEVPPTPTIIENVAYARRVQMYRGALSPDVLLADARGDEIADVTLAYGAGNWYLCRGDVERATHVFRHITAGQDWPAFAFIAAEADLARVRSGPGTRYPR